MHVSCGNTFTEQDSQCFISSTYLICILLFHCSSVVFFILHLNLMHSSAPPLMLCCINRFTSLCKNLFNLLEFLAEAFRCHVHHFQCLTALVELGPSSIENDAHGIKKLLLKTQVSWASSCIVKWIYYYNIL